MTLGLKTQTNLNRAQAAYLEERIATVPSVRLIGTRNRVSTDIHIIELYIYPCSNLNQYSQYINLAKVKIYLYHRTIMTRSDPNSHLAAVIRRGVTHLSRRLRAERSADSLSANKLLVLSHLYPNKECSPGAIASGEHLQPQSLSKLLAELETEGLIVRSKSPVDGRQSLLKITPEGRNALQHDMGERDLWLASALQHLSETELQLLHIAARILERLSDLDVRPSQVQE